MINEWSLRRWRYRSYSVLSGVLLPPFIDHVQRDRGYVTERPYIVLSLEVGGLWNRKSTLGGPEDLAIALTQNTDLKALVVHGYHDLGTYYTRSRYLLEQSVRSPLARKRLSFHNYDGDHMFYFRKDSRAALARDVRSFYEKAP
jgi:carboxypeptidase C (cathepsin A)